MKKPSPKRSDFTFLFLPLILALTLPATYPMNQRRSSHLPPCRRWAALVVLAAATFAPLLHTTPAEAHMKGMFKTKQEAEERAAEIKCKGAFAMGSLWMPCANEQVLHKALQDE